MTVKNFGRALACAMTLLGLPGFAQAVPQMLLPVTGTKAAKAPPADVRAGAVPVHVNARELHALKIGDEVELALPNGSRHAFVFDQRIDHGQGNATWIGYYRDRDQRVKMNAVITTGPDGSIGSIETPEGDFAIRIGGAGGDWLVDAKAERALGKPVDLRHDAKFVPGHALKKEADFARAEFAEVLPGVTLPYSSTVPMTDVVTKAGTPALVDMLVVYNDSLAAGVGNTTTWANNLIAQANTSLANSQVNIQLRLAGTMLYPYSDADTVDNETVLFDITGINPADFSRVNTAAHAAIESKRTAVGADMVTFYRGGNGGTFSGPSGGAGVAWTAQGPVTPSWAEFTYSTVIGCWSTCTYIWTHEVGHNMGNMHDRATAMWEATSAIPPSTDPGHGSYPYSWGFYTCNGRHDDAVLTCNALGGGCIDASIQPNCQPAQTTSAYRDLMAYFQQSTTLVRVFSNPNLACAAGIACGIVDGSTDPHSGLPDSADTASSMNLNAVALSALRASTLVTATATSLATSASPMRIGNPVTFTASLSASAGTPTGTVAFSSNGVAIAGCAGIVATSGSAQCVTSFASPGTYTVTARFTGSGTFGNSTSNAVSEVIGGLPGMIGGTARKLSFDGNATTDLGWMGPGPTGGAWLMNGFAFTPSVVAAPRANSIIRTHGDFNGDGKSDIVWRAPDGAYLVTLMSGASVASTATILANGIGWDVIGVGDFNGDGQPDLLWSAANGQFGLWLMNGTTPTPAVLSPPSAGFVPVLLGDLNGDRKTDIVWMNAAGAVVLTLMNGAVAGTTSGVVIPAGSGWRPTHLADLNGDGNADILWQHTDGSIGAWLMNGIAPLPGGTGGILAAGSGFSVVATPDLNADGKSDLAFQNAAGQAAVWVMNGLAPIPGQQAYIYTQANTGWSIVGMGDYNGDGKGDLLWKHASGSYGFWLMDGAQNLGAQVLLGDGTGWDVVAP